MSEKSAPSVFLGRQPIMDRVGEVVAYELLFRGSAGAGSAEFSSGLAATASVIDHAFSHLGLARVLGHHRGFINVDEDLLLSELVEILPAERVVLEILETVKVTPELVERCRVLKARGFTLALDDFVLGDEFAPLFPLVRIVKVDLLAQSDADVAASVRKLKPLGVELLAEKIDSQEQADRCRELGFDLFQGFYFARPDVLEGRRASDNRVSLLKLLGLVMGEAASEELVHEIKRNPQLTYSLLKLVNSVGSGLTSRVSSLPEAVMVLGRRQLARWVQLLLFTQNGRGESCRESPLFAMAACRGWLMEQMTLHLWPADLHRADQAFMIGILSLADALLAMPLAEILEDIAVSEEVSTALLAHQGHLGYLLRLVKSLEGEHHQDTAALLARIPTLSAERLTALQLAAMDWAGSICTSA